MRRPARSWCRFAPLGLPLLFSACPAAEPEPFPDGDSQAGDPGPGDPGGGDSQVTDFGPLDDFPLRVPGTNTVTCSAGEPYTGDFIEVDHVCRIDNAHFQGDIYLQANPTDCLNAMSLVPTEFSVTAFAKVGGVVSQISGTYDWGGNHHVDQIQFAVGGETFVIWHSSVAPGFHPCAPPDCMLTCPTGAEFTTCDRYGGFTVDGCERVLHGGPPPLPVLCARVNADGSVPPLLNPWEEPAGDPLLPCEGELDLP
jgi:hypothetical protein